MADDVREQIARVLRADYESEHATDEPVSAWYPVADAVLAVPAVAEAFAAVERVRALAEEFDVMGRVLHHVLVAETFAGVATDLRRALDGEP